MTPKPFTGNVVGVYAIVRTDTGDLYRTDEPYRVDIAGSIFRLYLHVKGDGTFSGKLIDSTLYLGNRRVTTNFNPPVPIHRGDVVTVVQDVDIEGLSYKPDNSGRLPGGRRRLSGG